MCPPVPQVYDAAFKRRRWRSDYGQEERRVISPRDAWRIFLIFFTLAVLLLASGVALQHGYLGSPQRLEPIDWAFVGELRASVFSFITGDTPMHPLIISLLVGLAWVGVIVLFREV